MSGVRRGPRRRSPNSSHKGQKLDSPEAREKARGARLVKALGLWEFSFSQPFRTTQTPGIPDSFYFGLLKGTASTGADEAVGFWWEWKAPGEVRTPTQVTVGAALKSAGQLYGWGDYERFVIEMVAMGWVKELPSGGLIPLVRAT